MHREISITDDCPPEGSAVFDDVLVGVAQAHAMLALAAATAMVGDFGSRTANAWRQAAGTTAAS